MKELKDYGGPFVKDIKFEDLSKETLARLLRVYCKEILTMDAYWQEQMRKRVDEQASRECCLENWCRIGKHEMRWTAEALNIKTNDVEAYLKINQFLPSFAQGVFDYDWDLRDKNNAVLTVRHCPAFSQLKTRDLEKLDWTCHVFEDAGMKAYTEALNPKIKWRPLKVGVTNEPDEIACKWEFYTE